MRRGGRCRLDDFDPQRLLFDYGFGTYVPCSAGIAEKGSHLASTPPPHSRLPKVVVEADGSTQPGVGAFAVACMEGSKKPVAHL